MDPAKPPDTAEMRLQRQVIDVSVYFEDPAPPVNSTASKIRTSREELAEHQESVPGKKPAIAI